MGRSRWVFFALIVAGCGSNGARAPASEHEHGDAGAPTSTTDTSHADGAAAASDEATLVMQPFDVGPGAEVYVCQSFANPFGDSVFIRSFESHMSTGSHHLIVNYDLPSASLDIQPCSGLIAPSGPFATQVPDDEYVYQDGIGAPLDADSNLKLISHYLNTTADTLAPTVTVKLRRVRAGQTVRPAKMQSLVYIDFKIPAHQTMTVEGGLWPTDDQQVLWLLPHMHSRGKDFVVTVGDTDPKTIFETHDWESAPHRFDPPELLHAGEKLAYSCTWQNDTNETLTFGESAATNEMCLLAYQYVTNE